MKTSSPAPLIHSTLTRSMVCTLTCLGLLALPWLSGCAHAQTDIGIPADVAAKPVKQKNTVTYQDRDEVALFAQELAATSGLKEGYVSQIVGQAVYQPSVVKAVMPPASPAVKNWQRYRARFVEPYRIKEGVKFWSNHKDTLSKWSSITGVPEEVMVAIIGVETIYGQHTGNYRVLDALATLAFDYPNVPKNRGGFFRDELAAFLKLCSETGMDPLLVKGSYAGAVGLGQFMPSSWRAYAVDGNGDGKVDLFLNVEDAIASVGNFLKMHGWVRGGAWFYEAQFNDSVDMKTLLTNDINPSYTAAQLQALGVRASGQVADDERLALIELVNGTQAPDYKVGTRNFYAVTRYNRSSFYAQSVLELATALKQEMALQESAVQAGKTPVDK